MRPLNRLLLVVRKSAASLPMAGPRHPGTPEHVRRLTWTPPAELTPASVDAVLVACGARPWQREHTVDILTAALVEPTEVTAE